MDGEEATRLFSQTIQNLGIELGLPFSMLPSCACVSGRLEGCP